MDLKNLKVYLSNSKRFLKCVLFPIITLPLPLIIRTQAAWCAYVVMYMAFLWITETIPMAVTAMIPIFAYPLLGIVESKNICTEYLTVSFKFLNFVLIKFYGKLFFKISIITR